jgi:para-nitrobenzyl esterase
MESTIRPPHWIRSALLAAAILCAPGTTWAMQPRPADRGDDPAAAAQQGIEAGVWYDREHSGHGLDLYRQGDLLFGTFYTYDASGAVQWLGFQTDASDASRLLLTRYRLLQGQLVGSPAGSIALTPATGCPDGLPRAGARALWRMDFTLDGIPASWCIEPLLPVVPDPLAVLSGAWYSPADSGWGVMSHAFTAADGSHQVFRTVYFYDAAGNPRWAFAQDRYTGLTQTQTYYTPYVECLGCSTSTVLTVPIGTATLTLTDPRRAGDMARNRVDMSLRFEGGAAFERRAALALLTAPIRVAGAAATREGPLVGRVLATGVERYDNIPFAQAPVGSLRWRAPQALQPRTDLRDARVLGPGCPQPPAQGLFTAAPAVQSEDCLQLQVWRPASAGPHPVMVWIHGGGLTQGSAVQQLGGALSYDGAGFAARNVVFVAINYRLGPFGYLAQRDLVAEAPDHPQSGNYGLLDQVAALAWVRDNIAAFGGDPGRVTIFGESAGGLSTCALLTAPAARGLFQRVIVQSGNCLNNAPTLVTALAQGDRVTAAAGCTNATDRRACLRALSALELLAVADPVIDTGSGMAAGESFGLVVDGFVLPESPGRAIAAGRGAATPLLIGVNDDEFTTLAPATSLPATVAGYEAAIRARFPTIATQILARYPAAQYATPQRAYQDLLDDVRFVCAARRAAADHAAQGNAVYHYVLTEILPDPTLAPLESFHGLDVVLLFGPRAAALAPERMLAEDMQGAWVDFASGREPGASAGLAWPRYGAAARTSQEFNAARSTGLGDYRQAYCEFWNQFGIL